MDAQFTSFINNTATKFPALIEPMILVTRAGIPLLVLLVAIRWWLGGRSRPERHVTVACGLSFIVGLALNQLILQFVHRPRPYDAGVAHLRIGPSSDFSFPSDHSTAAFTIAFAFLLHRRFRLGFWFLIGALLVGFSRIYLGVHYFGDVLGGMGTACCAAFMVRVAYREGTKVDNWLTGIL